MTVNAPKSGKITALLASEEDTVTVGQDLFKLETGEGGAGMSVGTITQSRLGRID